MHSNERDSIWLLEEKYGGKETPEYEADKDRLAKGEPVAYVIGHQPFLGLTIYLDSHPLIPRPETEWWANQLLTNVGPRRSHIRFIDLCAGSGAIGCAALAEWPNAQIYFGEIDPVHEATILKNIRENNLDESHADVRIGDLFEPFEDMRFDIIAINPPYIPSERTLDASVADYEPARALYAGNDGLDIIRRIAIELPKHLAPGGEAWIECDSAHVTAPTPGVGAPTESVGAACALFTAQGLNAEIRTDQYAKPRVIVVTKPGNTAV